MRKYSSPANRQTRTPAKKTPSKGGRSKGANSNPAAKDITAVVLGSYIIQPWYASSYPKKLVDEACASHGRIYVCERCFKYTPDVSRFLGHQKFCSLATNAAFEKRVYVDGEYSIYETDGAEHLLFCQNLCLLGKLFLDTKSLCYDVESFLFYTLFHTNSTTGHSEIVGFFSKEKLSWDNYNLACILVFPPFQRRGLGKLLIAFSYELSKAVSKIGSPEKPLSRLGEKGYLAYWSSVIAQTLLKNKERSLSVNELSEMTFIHRDDCLITLKSMGVLLQDKQTNDCQIDIYGRLSDANKVDQRYLINSGGLQVVGCDC